MSSFTLDNRYEAALCLSSNSRCVPNIITRRVMTELTSVGTRGLEKMVWERIELPLGNMFGDDLWPSSPVSQWLRTYAREHNIFCKLCLMFWTMESYVVLCQNFFSACSPLFSVVNFLFLVVVRYCFFALVWFRIKGKYTVLLECHVCKSTYPRYFHSWDVPFLHSIPLYAHAFLLLLVSWHQIMDKSGIVTYLKLVEL